MKDLGSKEKSNFAFKRTTTMMKADVDIACNDMLMNYTHLDDMAMNGAMLWQGFHKKNLLFFQILLEVMIVEGNLVLDYTESVG